MKIRQMGAQFYNADRETNTRDEANSRVSQLCERAW